MLRYLEQGLLQPDTKVVSTWHLIHHSTLLAPPPAFTSMLKEGFLPSSSPTSSPTTVPEAKVGLLAIHSQPSGHSLWLTSLRNCTYLPLMALKSRIPSAGPQTWTRSSLDIFSRSAPKQRHAPLITGKYLSIPQQGWGTKKGQPHPQRAPDLPQREMM